MLENGTMKPNKLVDILEIIGLQAEHSGQIIKQLRQFIRKEQPERSLININDLIVEVLLFLQPSANKANVTIIRQMDETLYNVLVQPIQIEQVLINLVKNAIEAFTVDTLNSEALYSNNVNNKRVIIKTEVVGNNAVVVSVEDNGVGIDDKVKEDLFDPFITSKNEGLGLGLSISQSIIESHHGKLYLHSEAGHTIFRFALPVASPVDTVNKKISSKKLVE
jgi:two-component system sensor histidine kinase TtrS